MVELSSLGSPQSVKSYADVVASSIGCLTIIFANADDPYPFNNEFEGLGMKLVSLGFLAKSYY